MILNSETRTIRTKIVTTMTTSSKPVHCRGCGEFLWVQVVDQEQAFVLIGSMRVDAISGTCWVCGEEYHWRAEEVRLERLTKRDKIV